MDLQVAKVMNDFSDAYRASVVDYNEMLSTLYVVLSEDSLPTSMPYARLPCPGIRIVARKMDALHSKIRDAVKASKKCWNSK